jgi:hypothetical protein
VGAVLSVLSAETEAVEVVESELVREGSVLDAIEMSELYGVLIEKKGIRVIEPLSLGANGLGWANVSG